MDIKKAMSLMSGFSSDELKKSFHDLKELNEYRKIGTVEELKHLKEMSEKDKEERKCILRKRLRFKNLS